MADASLAKELSRAPSVDRLVQQGAAAVAVIVPWWVTASSPTTPTFLKEWLSLLAVCIAGALLLPGSTPAPTGRRPSPGTCVIAVLLVGLTVQLAIRPNTWSRALLEIASISAFAVAAALGRSWLRVAPDCAFSRFAWCVVIAAGVTCLFSLVQLVGLDGVVPFVQPRVSNRLYGNVAQANHYADLLWLGIAAAVYLGASGRLRPSLAGIVVIVLQVFSVFAAARMVWLWVVLLAALGAILWKRGATRRRLAAALLLTAASYGTVAAVVNSSGLLDRFGVTSGERRMADEGGKESTDQRLWFWQTGIDAALQNPLLGIGPGQLPGFARARAMAIEDAPALGADAQAHNVFVQIGAELGAVVAVLFIVAVVAWFVRVVPRAMRRDEDVAALAMVGIIFIHANLEHPLGYLHFLVLLGLLCGWLDAVASTSPRSPALPVDGSRPRPLPALRIVSCLLFVGAIVAYVQFQRVDKATQILVAQARAGQPPQATPELIARLDGFPRWSPYVNFADTVLLMAAVPTAVNALALADLCERVVQFGPTPFLLSRCAVDLQVAGRASRASEFANSVCKIYPDSVPVLKQAVAFVAMTSPAATGLSARCLP